MAKVSYNSGEIAPVEAVSITYDPVFNDAGERISVGYNISLRGKLLANRGSPDNNGNFITTGTECQVIANTGVSDANWLESLLTKRCALNNLLDTDYLLLRIGTASSGSDLTCYPRVTNFTVDESDNPVYWPYSISFSADNLFCNGNPVESTGSTKVRSVSETWDFTYDEESVTSEYGDNRLYNVTHTVSAQGLKTFNPSGSIAYSAVDAARSYVQTKIGTLATQPTLAISGFDAYSTKYNYVDVHNIDVAGGAYSVTESWIYTTGNYTEEYTVESRTDNGRSCPTVSINGTVTGLCVRSIPSGTVISSKYDNALAFWNSIKTSGLKDRAESLTGLTLYSDPFSTSVSSAPKAGTINYTYEYRGGPTKQLTQASWENITVNTNFNEDIYAATTILGGGEIIQNINSNGYYKLYRTTLNIDAIYPCSTGIHKLGPRFTASTSGELQSLINQYNPVLTLAGVGYQAVDSQNESWNKQDSLYNYSCTWVFQMSGVCS